MHLRKHVTVGKLGPFKNKPPYDVQARLKANVETEKMISQMNVSVSQRNG